MYFFRQAGQRKVMECGIADHGIELFAGEGIVEIAANLQRHSVRKTVCCGTLACQIHRRLADIIRIYLGTVVGRDAGIDSVSTGNLKDLLALQRRQEMVEIFPGKDSVCSWGRIPSLVMFPKHKAAGFRFSCIHSVKMIDFSGQS